MIAQPKKRIRELIREYGGKHQTSDRTGDSYIFPDLMVLHVTKNPTGNWVAAQAVTLAKRYGRQERAQFAHLDHRSGAPRIDFEQLEASAHAKDRLKLMQSQARVEFREVLHCLRIPERVLWSTEHQSWCWVRGRIAVCLVQAGNQFVITTILWATADLFAQHPRPKEVQQ